MNDRETTRRSGCRAWQIVLAGCLGLVLLGVVAIGLIANRGVQMARQMQQAPPADPKVVAQQFAGIPIYPGAQLDARETGQMQQMTKSLRKTFGRWGGRAMPIQSAAVYTVPATPPTVVAWYDKKMGALGWSSQPVSPPRNPSAHPMEQRSYQKGGSGLLVMASSSGAASSRLQLMLMVNPAGTRRTP